MSGGDAIYEGGCLCGGIRFTAREDPGAVVHCYCSMCRRQSGTAMQTFARFERGSVDFDCGEPAWYRSSVRASRGFCPTCGSSLAFTYHDKPGELWLTAGSFDRADCLWPTRHFMIEERVQWAVCQPTMPAAPNVGPLETPRTFAPSGRWSDRAMSRSTKRT